VVREIETRIKSKTKIAKTELSEMKEGEEESVDRLLKGYSGISYRLI